MSEAGGHSSEWPEPIAGLLPHQTSLATVIQSAISRVYFYASAQNTCYSGYRARQICGFFMAEREANTIPLRKYARQL